MSLRRKSWEQLGIKGFPKEVTVEVDLEKRVEIEK